LKVALSYQIFLKERDPPSKKTPPFPDQNTIVDIDLEDT
jgi:hypothetical protein